MNNFNLFLRFFSGILFIPACFYVGRFAAQEKIALEVMSSFIAIILFIIFYTKKGNASDS